VSGLSAGGTTANANVAFTMDFSSVPDLGEVSAVRHSGIGKRPIMLHVDCLSHRFRSSSIRADSSPQICRITGLTTTASGVAQKQTSPLPGAGVLVASPAALLLRQTVNSVRQCSPLMGQCAGLHAITLGNSTLPPQMSLALMARLSSIHTFGMVPLMADPVPATKATRTASIRWNGKSGCAD
jgi:hypothetical protein